MKNKEIEELLNRIKKQLIIDEKFGIAKDFHKTTLNYKEVKLLLSYIEQLENNRDKAIEYIKENEKEYGSLMDNEKIILSILKGDSDETNMGR